MKNYLNLYSSLLFAALFVNISVLCTVGEKISPFSDVTINIRCRPDQKIVKKVKTSSLNSSFEKKEVVENSEDDYEPSLKVKIALALTAFAGFCYVTSERLVRIAAKFSS